MPFRLIIRGELTCPSCGIVRRSDEMVATSRDGGQIIAQAVSALDCYTDGTCPECADFIERGKIDPLPGTSSVIRVSISVPEELGNVTQSQLIQYLARGQEHIRTLQHDIANLEQPATDK